MSKDAYYFSHDSNARNDIKIVKLRHELGLEGYGLYWCVIEMLRESDKYELPIESIPLICFELRFDEKKFEILFDCELLFKGKKMFYSKSLKNRMLRLDEIKQKRKIAGAKGGKSKASAKQVLSKSKASKVKQSKVNESIVEYIKEECNGFADELILWLEFLKQEYDIDTGMINLESYLKLLNSWYENSDQKSQCLNKHIASKWKTLNHIDVKNIKSKEFEL